MIIGHKRITEAMGLKYIGRGAFQMRRRSVAMHFGAFGKANVGISNDNAGEKPARWKTKVS